MARIIQPPDLMTEIQELQRRIANLETQNITKLAASDGTVVLDVNNLTPAFKLLYENDLPVSGTLPFTTTQTEVATSIVTFTLTRAVSVLMVGQAVALTTGGTASSTSLSMKLVSAGTALGFSPGALLNTGQYAFPTQLLVYAALPAGTYSARYSYFMVGGAATTLAINGGHVIIFQIGP